MRTCGELARESVAKLQRHFGEDKGLWLAAMARGRDDDPVKDQSLVQSIGSGKKFEGPHTLKNLTVSLSEIHRPRQKGWDEMDHRSPRSGRRP